jgi:acyl-CoA synthetase (AMP-forming)/AMP-acid ligase II
LIVVFGLRNNIPLWIRRGPRPTADAAPETVTRQAQINIKSSPLDRAVPTSQSNHTVPNIPFAGNLIHGGRSDDMMKVGGIYVSPFEVEGALLEHDAVLEAAVVTSGSRRSDQTEGLCRDRSGT